MTIETQKSIGDFVFIMSENRPIRAEITGIHTTTTSSSYPNTHVRYTLYGIGGDRDESVVFSSKEDLIKSL